MMLGLLPVSFRFRGKVNRLKDIYRCFLDHPATGLHPTQIARFTGVSFTEVNRRLEATPELFVKLPRRPDGITRYRLTSSTAARSEEQIDAFIDGQARKEGWLLYSFGAMLLCLLLIVAVLVGPAV
jgi:hypothetical protein